MPSLNWDWQFTLSICSKISVVLGFGFGLESPIQPFCVRMKLKFVKTAQMSSGDVVVKLLACGARGPEFDSRSRRLDFRDWLSPASKSRYGWNIAKCDVNLRINQPIETSEFLDPPLVCIYCGYICRTLDHVTILDPPLVCIYCGYICRT